MEGSFVYLSENEFLNDVSLKNNAYCLVVCEFRPT